MKDLAIIPECYIDTNLIETLLPGVEVNHQKGCGTVAKKMIENFGNDFAVGIIDQDKQQLDYLNEFFEITKTDHLILYKHPNRNHFFIQIVPAMERFIIRCVIATELSLADYNLPEDFDKFRKVSKSVNSKTDGNYKKLFRKLISENERQLMLLQRWLEYLRANRHAVIEDELRALEMP
jgi:hypothetical protein